MLKGPADGFPPAPSDWVKAQDRAWTESVAFWVQPEERAASQEA